ncbi:MAG: hypothetical protein J6D26_00905 [Clostridia bacterium]|nr:hypothetical protein [Clostridia bacterium]
MNNTVYKKELINKISKKLDRERIVVGGNRHTYKRKYHLKYTEAIISKVLDTFWDVVADTISSGDKVQIQHYMSIFPKYTTCGNVNSYCVKTKTMSRLKEACKILLENEKGEETCHE